MGELVKSGSKYSDEDRRRAVVEFCVHGVMTKVAKVTGIPEQTLATWKNKTDWWDDLVGEARTEIGERILAQNMEVATKANERVLDSLEYGDEKLVWDKEKGEHVVKRVKPSGRDAMVMSGISQDKARTHMGMPTSITAKSDDMEALARQFQELSRKWNEKQIDVVSVQQEGESEPDRDEPEESEEV